MATFNHSAGNASVLVHRNTDHQLSTTCAGKEQSTHDTGQGAGRVEELGELLGCFESQEYQDSSSLRSARLNSQEVEPSKMGEPMGITGVGSTCSGPSAAYRFWCTGATSRHLWRLSRTGV